MAALTRATHQNLRCLDSESEDRKANLTYDIGDAGAGAHGSDADDRVDRLRRTIESQIIPRLMLTARTPSLLCGEARLPDQVVGADDVQEFTDLLLEGSARAVMGLIARLDGDGISRSAILLDLFAPAAKRLGELWETDVYTFADVTIAMGTLQQALRLLAPEPSDLDAETAPRRSILLALVTGEQHSFPVQILDAFFQYAGWTVETDLSFDVARVGAILRKRRFDAIGLSISRDSLLDQLACDIQVLRRVSRNQSLVILVGGRVFSGHPELVSRIGADATADDARSAVRVAEQLVSVAGGARR